MNGKDFERITLHRLEWEERQGRCTAGRYGVQGVFIDGKWSPIKSLPDLEGVLLGGRQFCFELKVCSQASFPLDDDKLKARQLKHLTRRARFGAIAFLLIHFAARELKTKSEGPMTTAFPVLPGHPFWDAFDRGESTRIARDDAEHFGVPVAWNAPGARKNSTPDGLAAILELSRIPSPLFHN